MKKIIGMFTLFAMGTMGSCSVMSEDVRNYNVTTTNATANYVMTVIYNANLDGRDATTAIRMNNK